MNQLIRAMARGNTSSARPRCAAVIEFRPKLGVAAQPDPWWPV